MCVLRVCVLHVCVLRVCVACVCVACVCVACVCVSLMGEGPGGTLGAHTFICAMVQPPVGY